MSRQPLLSDSSIYQVLPSDIHIHRPSCILGSSPNTFAQPVPVVQKTLAPFLAQYPLIIDTHNNSVSPKVRFSVYSFLYLSPCQGCGRHTRDGRFHYYIKSLYWIGGKYVKRCKGSSQGDRDNVNGSDEIHTEVSKIIHFLRLYILAKYLFKPQSKYKPLGARWWL